MEVLSVIQKSILNQMLAALMESRASLISLPRQEALRNLSAYGKSDSLMFDVLPEVTIGKYVRLLGADVFFITEEAARDTWPERPLCTIISDPTDRSMQFADFIKQFANDMGDKTLGELFTHQEAVGFWEKELGGPISITGPTTSVTCVWDDGSIIFNAILNYITGQLVLVANGTVLSLDTQNRTEITFDQVMNEGVPVKFPTRTLDPSGSTNKFVTFLRKSEQYVVNLADSGIMGAHKDNIFYDAPGGPTRPLYLSEFQPAEHPIGFILSNGEKLPEWMGWLAFAMAVKNSHQEQGLRLFEVSTPRPHMREGVLMSTSPQYSLFREEQKDGKFRVNINMLRNFKRPSQFRSMLVLVPDWNYLVINALRGNDYREIRL